MKITVSFLSMSILDLLPLHVSFTNPITIEQVNSPISSAFASGESAR